MATPWPVREGTSMIVVHASVPSPMAVLRLRPAAPFPPRPPHPVVAWDASCAAPGSGGVRVPVGHTAGAEPDATTGRE